MPETTTAIRSRSSVPNQPPSARRVSSIECAREPALSAREQHPITLPQTLERRPVTQTRLTHGLSTLLLRVESEYREMPGLKLTEAQARDAGYDVAVKVQAYGDVAYGWAMEDTTGFCKLIADRATGRLLGAHLMGPQASSIIQPAIQAMSFGLGVRDAVDGRPTVDGTRVVPRDQRDGHGRPPAATQRDTRQRPACGGGERGQEVAFDQRKDGLRLGVAEAAVVLEHPGAV